MNNLVHSLKFELHCHDEQQAFVLRRTISGEMQDLIAEIIDSVCNRHIPGTEVIQIGRLDLDLGNIDTAALDEQFARQFRTMFEARLLDELKRQAEHNDGGSATDPVLQVFIHFMRTGRLPWWADPATQDLGTICRDLVLRMPEAVLSFFRQHAADHRIWLRVIRQLDHSFRQFLFDNIDLLSEAQAVMAGVVDVIRQVLSGAALPSMQGTTGPQLAALVSDEPRSGPSSVTGAVDAGIAGRVLEELLQYGRDNQVYLLKHAPELFAAVKRGNSNNLLLRLLLEDLFPASAVERKSLKELLQSALHLQLQQSRPEPGRDRQEPLAPLPAMPVLPERIMVPDAGLVLLGPYLKPLFTTLGYWQEGAWQSPEAREKAVCLLHFIVTGVIACKEYDLVLGKLLCGIPLEEPLYTGYDFTAAETGEAEALLEAVIANWTALKNTSVAGFRTAFLQREAVLFPKEQDWQLVVERRTLDVLLESIPWGYGTLALSWNTYLIFTTW